MDRTPCIKHILINIQSDVYLSVSCEEIRTANFYEFNKVFCIYFYLKKSHISHSLSA